MLAARRSLPPRLTTRKERPNEYAAYIYLRDHDACHHAFPIACPDQSPDLRRLLSRDPRQLVGQGDDHDIAMGPAHQPFHPPAKRRVALRYIGQRGARSMDQLFAQILVAAFADSEQLRLAAGGELSGNQTEPGGEIATVVEAFRPTTAATRADATIAPTPGMVVSRRASSFSFTQRTNSVSKAVIRRSRSAHCARAPATSTIIRGLNPAPPCHPSARPGTARASACPAARPFLAPAEWRAAD
jgi:hypothetical protein